MTEDIQRNSLIPPEEWRKFNWGAFLLGWVWGIFNKSYITLIQLPLSLIPVIGGILNLCCAIWFGFKGNGWALKNKDFENLEQFNKFQRKFIITGLVLYALVLGTSIAIIKISPIVSFEQYIKSLILIDFVQCFNVAIFVVVFIILSELKLIYKALTIFLVFLLMVCCNFYSSGENYVVYLSAKAKYKEAVAVSKIVNKFRNPKVNNENYYNALAVCYLSQRDFKNAIMYYEKAQARYVPSPNMGDNTLTYLYFITGNYEKIKERNMEYIINFGKEDWNGVIQKANERIEKCSLKTIKDGNTYCTDDKVYLARALAYKKMGKTESAEKDYQTALLLTDEREKASIEKIYNNNENHLKKYILDLENGIIDKSKYFIYK